MKTLTLVVLAGALVGCSFTIPDSDPYSTGRPRPECTPSAPVRIGADATAGIATGALALVGLLGLGSATDGAPPGKWGAAVIALAAGAAALTYLAAVTTGLDRTSRCREAQGAWVDEQDEIFDECKPIIDRWFDEQDPRRRDELHAGMSRECRRIVDSAVEKVAERRRRKAACAAELGAWRDERDPARKTRLYDELSPDCKAQVTRTAPR